MEKHLKSDSQTLMQALLERRDKLGLTSGYGESSASEFFAEAFADVYEHGKKARPASIALVKEYDRLRERKKKAMAGIKVHDIL